ncbi:hypothetical protein LZZ90_00530 [Flavobacterium sp. SM15]|uniref:hypothetical protein n=1 Tax=Flavobacterium sp. SM15 TaxID=2908005 RepID=UPI001ED9FF36|nr:hypothetical protein [Flavobacterium sp. SM15]MCG2609987.1 hypothetical protein [Flavobacterium sp. SM15]
MRLSSNAGTFIVLELEMYYVRIDEKNLAPFIQKKIIECYPDGMDDISLETVLDCVLDDYNYAFSEKALSFGEPILYESNIDTKHKSFMPFQNGVVEISSKSIERLELGSFPHKRIDSDIIQRSVEIKGAQFLKGEYTKFVWLLADKSLHRFKAFVTVIGYLVHRYKDPANPKIIILLDQVANDSNGANGGVDKSLLIKALSYALRIFEIGGKSFKTDYTFTYDGIDEQTAIMLLNDAPKNAHLDSFFNFSTDAITIHRKYKSSLIIPFEKSPKVVITTNHMIKQTHGNSSERRKYQIELSNHFGANHTPKDEFGHLLFLDWEADSEQWHHYYNFIFFCVQYYLCFGLINPPKINIDNRALLAEVGEELIEFLDEKLAEGITKLHKQDLFNEFVSSGAIINRNNLPAKGTFTRKVKLYFNYKNIDFKETPSDTKKYFEIITDKTIEELTQKDINSVDTDYKLVDTPIKLKKAIKDLKNS